MKQDTRHQILHHIEVDRGAIDTYCAGCSWVTSAVLFPGQAVLVHDEALGLVHDHTAWVPTEQPSGRAYCPCGHPLKQRLDVTEMSSLEGHLLDYLSQNNNWRPVSDMDRDRVLSLAMQVGDLLGDFIDEVQQ